MKAFILLCAATLAWPIFVNAETVTTTDGRTITLNEDGTYVIEAGTTSKVDDYVTLLDAFLEDHTSQYDEQSIRFMPKLRNEAESAIVGVRFTATFHDAFGDEIFKLEGDMNERIAPGASSTANVFYVFKNNPFIGGEAYDRLLPMVRGNTGSTVTMITGLALADGEVVSF